MSRPITSEEMAALQFATVRESRGCRNWPTEAVTAFLAAEVICGGELLPRARAVQHTSVNMSAHLVDLVATRRSGV